jgi:hypothetical protein
MAALSITVYQFRFAYCGSMFVSMIMQLLHVASDKYVTVHKREPAAVERNAMKVSLDTDGNEGSWLLVEPVFRRSKHGDPVCSYSYENA